MQRLPLDLQNWAANAGWTELRPIQTKCWDWFAGDEQRDSELLVCAPTATGKTEAVFLPLVSGMGEWGTQGFEVLYICPLKALIDQQAARLKPLFAIRDIRVTPWHEEARAGRAAAERSPEGVLIITPESLESVLRSESAIRKFGRLQAVVIDEVHAFFENPRGTQIIAQLARIEAMTGRRVRRIGLSATLSDDVGAAAKRFLRPATPDTVKILSDDTQITDLTVELQALVQPIGAAAEGDRASARDQVLETIRREVYAPITCTMEELKARTIAEQSYSSDWSYTWNPLSATPLIRFDPTHPERVIRPIPRHLLLRASAGIFYDLISQRDFDNPFGASFEKYVGQVLALSCPAPRFRCFGQAPYYVGGDKHHGADWILSDDSGHVFIEAKTKRLTVKSRMAMNSASLDNDLRIMATAIVQNYRIIQDTVDGKTAWIPDENPIYPVIITLEDWIIISQTVADNLDALVKYMLLKAGLAEDLLTSMPYIIASADEFEIAAQVISQVGITPVLSNKSETALTQWSLLPTLQTHFGPEMARVRICLFMDEWNALSRRPDALQ